MEKIKTGKWNIAPGGNFDGQIEEDFRYLANGGSFGEYNGRKKGVLNILYYWLLSVFSTLLQRNIQH